jgi:hydroxyquinol 1,2-dioxygenase
MAFVTEENISEVAEQRWSTCHDPRLAEIMTALIRHSHAFVREVGLTHEEWLAATEYLAATGQISDDKRKEFILLSDVLGLSMLVVMQNGRTPDGATPNTVLGPFHIDESPALDLGGAICGEVVGTPCYVSGTVRDMAGSPVAGALLDIWQADEEGTYEAQIADCEPRLRGLQQSDADGRYGFWTVAPKGYTIPMDGPVGALIERTDISHFRPAHIHFLIAADGHRTIVTHLFREGAPYLDDDVVFGARDELVVPFLDHPPGQAPDGRAMTTPFVTVDYDFVLVPATRP